MLKFLALSLLLTVLTVDALPKKYRDQKLHLTKLRAKRSSKPLINKYVPQVSREKTPLKYIHRRKVSIRKHVQDKSVERSDMKSTVHKKFTLRKHINDKSVEREDMQTMDTTSEETNDINEILDAINEVPDIKIPENTTENICAHAKLIFTNYEFYGKAYNYSSAKCFSACFNNDSCVGISYIPEIMLCLFHNKNVLEDDDNYDGNDDGNVIDDSNDSNGNSNGSGVGDIDDDDDDGEGNDDNNGIDGDYSNGENNDGYEEEGTMQIIFFEKIDVNCSEILDTVSDDLAVEPTPLSFTNEYDLVCNTPIWTGYYNTTSEPLAVTKGASESECLNMCNDMDYCVAFNYITVLETCIFLDEAIQYPEEDLVLEKYNSSFQYFHVLSGCIESFSFDTSTLEQNDIPCGIPSAKFYPNIGELAGRKRILGGSEAVEHSYPYVVKLETNEGFNCQGVLIPSSRCPDYSDLVLTAAHCTYNEDNVSYSEAEITVYLGKHNLSKIEETQTVTKVVEVIRHPNYDPDDFPYDYAILKLGNAIEFSDYTRPICLPKKGANPMNPKTCIVAGWGVTDKNESSPVLKQLIEPILGDEICEASVKEEYNISSMMCAGNLDSTKITCKGDSGGPLMCFENGKYVVYGLVSFESGGDSINCGTNGNPEIYSRVSSIIDWIEETREELENPRTNDYSNEVYDYSA